MGQGLPKNFGVWKGKDAIRFEAWIRGYVEGVCGFEKRKFVELLENVLKFWKFCWKKFLLVV